MRSQLLLDLGAGVAGSPLKILLRIGKLIGVESELSFGHFEVVAGVARGRSS